MKLSKNLKLAINSCLLAGNEIMQIYNSDNFEIDLKEDNSPLTTADIKSNNIINNILQQSGFPIISEESSNIDYQIRKNWDLYWLVDPIDGTKEFIKKNGEFTVNVSLIKKNIPILGVVYAPAFKLLYFAEKNFGAYKASNILKLSDLNNQEILNLKNLKSEKKYTIVVSRSHMNDETKDFINRMKEKYIQVFTVSYGSSLKICKVADGSANCYPRFGYTMEWDIAAAYVVAKVANCSFTQVDGSRMIQFNKKKLINPYFIVEKDVK